MCIWNTCRIFIAIKESDDIACSDRMQGLLGSTMHSSGSLLTEVALCIAKLIWTNCLLTETLKLQTYYCTDVCINSRGTALRLGILQQDRKPWCPLEKQPHHTSLLKFYNPIPAATKQPQPNWGNFLNLSKVRPALWSLISSSSHLRTPYSPHFCTAASDAASCPRFAARTAPLRSHCLAEHIF